MKKTNEKNLNERACTSCGCVCDIEDMLQIENAYYCSECADICECGSLVLVADLITVNRNRRDEQCACNRCVHTSDFFVCRSCDGLFTQNHYWGCYNDESICDNCSNNYVACEQCDRVVLTEDAYYEDESHQYLCYECFHQSLDSIINDYYYKPCPVFHGNTSDNGFLGVELEVDNTTDDCSSEEIKGCARALISNYSDSIYLKHDGSLLNGFEIVSHPMTLDYHMSQFSWADIMNRCLDANLRSHDTSSCGLHIHISRSYFGSNESTQDLNIAKLLILISEFYQSHILKFSRRKEHELRWCCDPAVMFEKDDNEETVIGKMKYSKSKGRYQAVNLQNPSTVEFRIFKGTLKHTTFIAALQFVVVISEYAKNTKLADIPSTNWEDIFMSANFNELNEYLNERGLN